ncbi:uncharacterized protein LOC124160523 isoform X2 [Ischnura elegans]|uniref:uncharacterized protein LOC124160523 isoform X1 n=1 Tax=Ischnura elegans TaxID=197161 RepID=UPI001ED885DC|nr:uncharacterized protein LOC124160523 isoform X1 [Ischnura elegans]XP_046392339.1 uncharacterized protein LOC124160523 isoform X2 [Ischnura elegans]
MDPEENLGDRMRREDLAVAIGCMTGDPEINLLGIIDAKRATGGVDGFTSVVLRVNAAYRTKRDEETVEDRRAALVVKTAPTVESQIFVAKACRVFIREGVFFRDVVPLMRKASAGRVEVPVPECYLAISDGENDAIYMEDLAARGFRTPDRSYQVEGLDLNHCVLAMKALGRLHALGIAAERLLPAGVSVMETFPDIAKDATIYDREPGEPEPFFKGLVEKGFEVVTKICKHLDGLPKAAAESGVLENVLKGLWPSLKRLIKPSEKGMNVIAHGDYWMNNIMVKYESDGVTPIDAKILDFQAVRYCHPAVDVMNFMHICTQRNFRDKYFESLVNDYYDSMTETLKAISQPIPFSKEDFVADLYGKYRTFGVIISNIYLPMMMLGEEFAPSNAEDMTEERYDDLFKSGCSSSILRRYASDSRYRAKMDVLIREFVEVVLPYGLDSVELSPLLQL